MNHTKELPANPEGKAGAFGQGHVKSTPIRGGAEAQLLVPATGWLRTFSSLRISGFRWYWLSVLAGFMAFQMQFVARGWLVYTMTDSALALGLVSAAWGIPIIILAPLGGVIADRLEKRNLIVLAQSLAGAITLVVAILIATGAIQFWHLLAASLVNGCFFAFSMPARQAIVPELVGERQLMNAIALNSSGMNVTRIAGPALGGVLVGIIGIPGVYFIVSACYVVVVLTMLMVPTLELPVSSKKASIMKSLAEGLSYIRHSSVILTLLATVFVITLFIWPYMMLMPVFARDVLDIGAGGLGILMSASGVGALVGSLAIASLVDFRRKGLLLLGLALLSGASLVLFANSGFFYLSLFLLLFVGAGSTGFFAVNNTLLQSNVTHEVRGRVMSIYMMTWGLQSFGTLPVAAVAEVLGAPLALGVSGAVVVLFTLAVTVLHSKVRRLE